MYLFYHVVWSFLGNAGLCEVIPFIIIMTIILCWAGGAGHCRNNTRGSITILHCARIKYKSKLMSLGCNLTIKTIWIACCLLGSMFTWRIYRLFQAESPLLRGSLYISQINHLLLYLLLWLLVPGSSSHFCHCLLYNLLLRSPLVSNILGKWLQDFVSFRNPCFFNRRMATAEGAPQFWLRKVFITGYDRGISYQLQLSWLLLQKH